MLQVNPSEMSFVTCFQHIFPYQGMNFSNKFVEPLDFEKNGILDCSMKI